MSDRFQNFIKLYETTASADSGGEYILPDNMPDVKRILHVMTNVRKTGTYSDASSLYCEGEVGFGVIYAGDDSALHHVGYTSVFSAKAPCREAENGTSLISRLLTPETSARLNNPRKFSLRAKIPVSFTVCGTENCEPYIDGVEDGSIEYDTVNDSSDIISAVSERSVPVSEDLHVPPGEPEPEQIIALYVMPGAASALPGDGTVTVKFDADVIALYRAENKKACMYTTSIHVSHNMSAETCTPDSVCECEISVYDVKYDLAADANGEMRVIELDLVYDIEAVCRTPSKGGYTADMYSTERESEAVYKEIKISHALPVYSANYTLSGEAPGSLRGPVVFATAECENARIIKDGGMWCEGNIGVYAVTDVNGEFESVSFSFPFRVPVTAKNVVNADGADAICSVSLPSVRASGDKLHADAELYMNVFAKTEKTAKAVSTLKITETPVQKRKSALVLYRPGKNETRWQTAKRFKVPLSKLNEDNPADAKILVIPG